MTAPDTLLIALLFVTARRENGFAAVHDLLAARLDLLALHGRFQGAVDLEHTLDRILPGLVPGAAENG